MIGSRHLRHFGTGSDGSSKGAERLRQAGFSEQHIQKWEKGKNGSGPGGEAGEEDVRWSQRWEGRELIEGKWWELMEASRQKSNGGPVLLGLGATFHARLCLPYLLIAGCSPLSLDRCDPEARLTVMGRSS